MKKLSLFLILFILASCMGSKTENTSILKKEKDNEIALVEEAGPLAETAREDTEWEFFPEEEVEKSEETEGSSEMAEGIEEETIEKLPALEEEAEEAAKEYDWEVVRTFEERVTSKENIKYQGELPEYLNYVIVKSPKVNLREEPATESAVVSAAVYGQKLQVLELVENRDGSQWYRVKDREEELFVYSGIVSLREFRFDKAEEKIRELEEFIGKASEKGEGVFTVNAYVPDPNNANLKRDKDRYGNVRDQSAESYYNEDKIYVPDGTIVAVQKDLDGKYRIRRQEGDEPYLDIPKFWVDTKNRIEEMPRKVIVVDVENQNFTVYEKTAGEWHLISYVYSKTGLEGQLGFKTPRGSFAVLAVKKLMTYNDAKGKYQGYAEHAIRFSGGGYVHGIPFNREEKNQLERYRREREDNLGTYPGTRKCVRNSVEHAKFLFDWVVGTEVRKGNFQGIEEKVSVIVM